MTAACPAGDPGSAARDRVRLRTRKSYLMTPAPHLLLLEEPQLMSLNYPGYVDRDGRAGDRSGTCGDETYADVIALPRPGHHDRTIHSPLEESGFERGAG